MRPLFAAFLTAVLAAPLNAQAWQSSLDSLAKLNQFSGVVLVARGGVPQFDSFSRQKSQSRQILEQRSSARPLPGRPRNIIVA